jgi:hypothetical protein
MLRRKESMLFVMKENYINRQNMETIEFKIGDTVTLDRYNHIDDMLRVKVVGYYKSL